MAIIVERGTRPVRWTKEVRCVGEGGVAEGGCGTLFRVFADDVYLVRSGPVGRAYDVDTVCCPACGQEHEIAGGPEAGRGTRPSFDEMRARRNDWNSQFKTKE